MYCCNAISVRHPWGSHFFFFSDTYTDLLLGAPGEGDGERRKRGRGRGRKGSQGESEGFLLGDGDEDMEVCSK